VNPGWAVFDWGDTLMVDFACSGSMARWPQVQAVDHAHETLSVLRSMGWHIAVATNAGDSGEADVREALARVGLDALVDRVFSSHDVGFKKPSSEFFDAILAALGQEASGVVMIGDNPGVDVVGANRAGIRAIWLRRPERSIPPDPMRETIDDLLQLPAVLEAW